jgi:hypothetical protein
METQQPLPDITFIELKEKNRKTITNQVGDYTVNLDHPITLKNQDSIQLQSAFIDSSATSSNLIIVEPDAIGGNTTTISMTFGYYVVNIPSSQETPTSQQNVVSKTYEKVDGTSADAGEMIEGYPYIACHLHDMTAGPDFATLCGSITVNFDKEKFKLPTQLNVTIEYHVPTVQGDPTKFIKKTQVFSLDDMSGATDFFVNGSFTVDMDTQAVLYSRNKKGALRPVIGSPIHFPFMFIDGTLSADIDVAGVKLDNPPFTLGTVPNGTGPHRTTITNTISTTVPSGKYTAGEISKLIGEGFTSTNPNNTVIDSNEDTLTSNPMIQTIRQMIRDANVNNKSKDDKIEFVRNDGKVLFRFNTTADTTTQNYVIGSGDFGLIYNDDNAKMELDLIHMSLLDLNPNSLGQPQIRGYKNQGGVGFKFFANKYSGIYIEDLQPRGLWFDKGFKFDPSILVSPTYATETINNVQSVVPTFLSTNKIPNALVDGVNITGDDKGLNTIITKAASATAGEAYSRAYDLADSFPTFPAYLAENVSANIGILASGIVNGAASGTAQQDIPYYQLEIDFGVQNKILGKDVFTNKIGGIISKYFSQGSYTSSMDGSGAIEYIHKGQDLEISSFRVRVLDDNGNLANDIDDNNTIFLKLLSTK